VPGGQSDRSRADHAGAAGAHHESGVRQSLDGPSLDAYLYWHASVDADPANLWLRERIGCALATADADA
jgi:hypothetical protein